MIESAITFTIERPSDFDRGRMTNYNFIVNQIKSTDRVADISCGNGFGTIVLAEKAASAYGCDYSKEAIDYAKEMTKGHSNINFKVKDLNIDTIEGRQFDVIVSLETIEHLKDPARFISMLAACLKPEGILFLSTPNKLHSKHDNPFHINELSYPELARLLKSNGLEVMNLWGAVEVGDIGSKARKPVSVIATAILPKAMREWLGRRVHMTFKNIETDPEGIKKYQEMMVRARRIA